MIEKRFNKGFKEADEQIRSKSYDDDTAKNLKILSSLAGISTQLAQRLAINNLVNRLRDMMTLIINEVEACLTSISKIAAKNEIKMVKAIELLT